MRTLETSPLTKERDKAVAECELITEKKGYKARCGWRIQKTEPCHKLVDSQEPIRRLPEGIHPLGLYRNFISL